MEWCATCRMQAGGWSRRQVLRALGQACLLVGLAPRASRAFTIVDEATDTQIGREADPEILKRYGYYDGPEIQNYLAEIGRRVVGGSDIRFSYQFKVLDQSFVNAMALPGGYIYVTRGMLAEMNDEAQLACVLGHEATHVNSRHGAKLLTKALGAQLATLVGVGAAAAAGGGGAVSGVLLISQHITNYMMLGYGREYEQEADEVGLRYAQRAGYDPRRMVTFLRTLRRKEILRGQAMYHALEADHPDTASRIAKADTMASLLVTQGGPLEVKADAYKSRLDGLKYGEAGDGLRLKVYTVQPGDTLSGVAQDQLGNPDRRFELASLNDIRDDATLTPGSRLKLAVKGDALAPATRLKLDVKQ